MYFLCVSLLSNAKNAKNLKILPLETQLFKFILKAKELNFYADDAIVKNDHNLSLILSNTH